MRFVRRRFVVAGVSTLWNELVGVTGVEACPAGFPCQYGIDPSVILTSGPCSRSMHRAYRDSDFTQEPTASSRVTANKLFYNGIGRNLPLP